jgi:hypothetical protein
MLVQRDSARILGESGGKSDRRVKKYHATSVFYSVGRIEGYRHGTRSEQLDVGGHGAHR